MGSNPVGLGAEELELLLRPPFGDRHLGLRVLGAVSVIDHDPRLGTCGSESHQGSDRIFHVMEDSSAMNVVHPWQGAVIGEKRRCIISETVHQESIICRL